MKVGQRVKLKGREPTGIIKAFGLSPQWVSVDWDSGVKGPKYVHVLELDVGEKPETRRAG